MYEEWIQSLCIVVTTNSGESRLLRVADLNSDDVFIPYSFRGQEFDDFNRDIIYHPLDSIPSQGNIAVWRWTSYNNRQESVLEKKIAWIEYILLDDVTGLDSLKNILINGVENIDQSHDYLFEFDRLGGKDRVCAFLHGKDFNMASNNKVKVKDDIYFLDIVVVSLEDIYELNTMRIPNLIKSYYGKLFISEFDRVEVLRPVETTIKQIILSRIKKYTPNLQFDNKGRGVIRDFLRFIPASSLAEDIAITCKCGRDTAEVYLSEFLKSCENFFSCDDFDAQMLLV